MREQTFGALSRYLTPRGVETRPQCLLTGKQIVNTFLLVQIAQQLFGTVRSRDPFAYELLCTVFSFLIGLRKSARYSSRF